MSVSGVVTAMAVGVAIISVTSEGMIAMPQATTSAELPSPVATVTLSRSSIAIAVHQATLVTATPRDARGNAIAGVTVTWSTSNESIARVSSEGTVIGEAIGSTTITATAQGKAASAPVLVSLGKPDAELTGCRAPDITSWDFAGGKWGPLDHTTFIGVGHIVPDITAAKGFSVQWEHTRRISPDDGGQVNATFPRRQSVYVRFAYKQSLNFPDDGIRKILVLRAPGYEQLLGTLDIDADRFVWFYNVLDAHNVWYQTAGPSPSSLRGSWHWFEVFNDISQSGHLQFKVWLDGVLIMSGVDPAGNQGLSMGIASPGGTFNAPAGDGTDWITSIGVSTSCIGAP